MFGLREVWREVSMDFSLISLRAKSRDRQSVTTLSIPGRCVNSYMDIQLGQLMEVD